MNLKHKVLGTVGVVALGLSLTSGIAYADDAADTIVDVNCPYTSTVDVNVNGNFAVDSEAGDTSASLPDGFEIVLDLTCNWSNDFTVGATIGTFEFDGVAPVGSAQSFSGSHLLLSGGSGVYDGVTVPLIAGAPNVEANVFELLQTSDPDVIENDTFFGLWGLASPGVTTATWDGSLSLLPLNLAGGQYIAPLTVTLTVN